jgi:hypothetical protein
MQSSGPESDLPSLATRQFFRLACSPAFTDPEHLNFNYCVLQEYSREEQTIINQARLYSEQNRSYLLFRNILLYSTSQGAGQTAFACQLARLMGVQPIIFSCGELALALTSHSEPMTDRNEVLLDQLYGNLYAGPTSNELSVTNTTKPPVTKFFILENLQEFANRMQGDPNANLSSAIKTITRAIHTYRKPNIENIVCVTKLLSPAEIVLKHAILIIPEVFSVKISLPGPAEQLAIMKFYLHRVWHMQVADDELQKYLKEGNTPAQAIRNAKLYTLEHAARSLNSTEKADDKSKAKV